MLAPSLRGGDDVADEGRDEVDEAEPQREDNRSQHVPPRPYHCRNLKDVSRRRIRRLDRDDFPEGQLRFFFLLF